MAWSSEEKNLLREFAIKAIEAEKATNDKSQPSTAIDLGSAPPLGELPAPVPPDCHPANFQAEALSSYQNANQYAKLAKQYFSRCSKYLTSGNTQGLVGLLKFANTPYDIRSNTHIQSQLLHLSDGTKMEAFIGLKDNHVKRPWIIAKCGVFCDVSTSNSSVNFIINYFDQSPFNFIFISNHTGEIHIKDNSRLTLGGLYEVYDLYDIAKWLKFESPYKETVDSIHSVGISLGGSTALAVSHLSHLYRSPDGRPLFNSSTAICPVVNLGPTLEDMYSDSFKGKVFTQYTWSYLRKAAPSLGLAHDYLSKKNAPPVSQFPQMLAEIVLRYGHQWDLSAPPNRVIESPKAIQDFLKINNFSDYTQPIDVPTFAWASKDDHIVNYDLNTKTLVESVAQKDNLGSLALDHGDHCAFDTAYGFTTTTMIFQSFILANSPNFLEKRRSNVIPVPAKSLTLKSGDVHLRQWWEAESERDSVTLFYETFNANRGLHCRWANPFESDSSCRSIKKRSVPIAFLKSLGITEPQTKTDAEVLSRALNIQLRLTSHKKTIDGSSQQPDQLSWYSYAP